MVKQPCEPIKDREKVKEILEALKMRRNGFRDSLYFEFMLSTGLRVSDGLAVQKKDIDFIEGVVRVRIKKTNSFKIIKLNTPLLRDLHTYTKDMEEDERIFPFQRQWSHKLMKWVTDFVGMDKSRYSMHTTRKTSGWFFYVNSGYDVVKTMHFLGHRDTKETMAYLMISEEEVNQQLSGMDWR